MKSCALLYNEKASRFSEKTLLKIAKTIIELGYVPTLIKSTYPELIVDNISDLNNCYDVILTMGGDGTVGNAYEAFFQLQESQKALYGHIPLGTTNDMGPNTNVPRYNPVRATKLILNGKVENRDIITINDHAMAYVAASGIIAPVTYLIDDSAEEKKFGTFSYVKYGVKEICSNPELFKNITENPYEITYKTENKTVSTKAILIAIFNAKSFANLSLNPQANMKDGKFYVTIIKNTPEIIKGLASCMLYKNGIMDLNDNTFSTDYLKVTFNDRVPYYPLNCDGDKKDLLKNTNLLEAKVGGKVLQLVGRTYRVNEDE